MISHVSSRPNWYSTHAVCNKRFFFFFSKIATILVIWKHSDRETPSWDFACLQQLSEGVSHNIEEK